MLCDPDEDYTSDEDDDYLPSGEASEGESEDDIDEEGHDGGGVKGQGKVTAKKGSKRKRPKVPETKRSRTGGIFLQDAEAAKEPTKEGDDDEPASIFKEELQRAAEVKKEEKEKRKADDLWSSFMKDVGQKPKAKPQSLSGSSSDSLPKQALPKQVSSGMNGKEAKLEKADATSSVGKKTVTVTKVFDFAGEEVKVTEEVSADSKEAKKLLESQETVLSATCSLGAKTDFQVSTAGLKRPGGGLSSVLGLIDKKPKMSVLEKSRLDWTKFTTTEGITDDLKIHNKGKEGYIEKQKFLQQTDQRQYEKERDMRMGQVKR